MKTIVPIGGGTPERRKNEDAKKLVETGEWRYCGKKEWKIQVRDREKLEAEAKRQADAEARRQKLKEEQAVAAKKRQEESKSRAPTGKDRFNKKWRHDLTA